MPEQPVAEYVFSPARRRDLLWSGLFFGAVGGFCFLGGLYRLRWPVPGDETPALLAVAVMSGALAAACLRALLTLPRAGRLAFFADRAELPQSLAPPWCFLAPRRLEYAAVVRWGATEVTALTPVIILVFAVAPPGGRKERCVWLTISHYPDPSAVREEFRKRLPPPRAVEIGSVFGTASFGPELAPEPPGPGRVPWSAEAQAGDGRSAERGMRPNPRCT